MICPIIHFHSVNDLDVFVNISNASTVLCMNSRITIANARINYDLLKKNSKNMGKKNKSEMPVCFW